MHASAYCSKYLRSVLTPIDAASARTLTGPPWPVAYSATAIDLVAASRRVQDRACVDELPYLPPIRAASPECRRSCVQAAARQLLDERLKPDPCAPEVLEVRLIVAITEVPGKCRSTPLAERPMDDTTLLSSFLRRHCRHERVEVLLLDHERERLELRGSSGLSGADDDATQHQRFHHSSALRQAASAVRHLRHVDRSSANSRPRPWP